VAGGWILINRRTPNRASRRKMPRSTDSSREIQRRQVLVKTAAVRRQQRQERGPHERHLPAQRGCAPSIFAGVSAHDFENFRRAQGRGLTIDEAFRAIHGLRARRLLHPLARQVEAARPELLPEGSRKEVAYRIDRSTNTSRGP
jgi:hypothetical protein